MRKLFKTLLLLALCCLLPFEALAARDVTVKSFTPTGIITESRPKFCVIFSGKVVKKTLVGKKLRGEECPLKFRPALPGTAKWVSRNKLYFTPDRALSPSTRYTVDFGPGGLKTANGHLVAGNQTFTFSGKPLRFESVSVLKMTPYRSLTLQLNFNAPVSPVRLKGFLHLTDNNGNKVDYSLRGETPGHKIIVDTERVNSSSLKVRVDKGLLPENANMAGDKACEATFTLSPQTAITGSYADSDIPGRGSIHISLNNPIDPTKAKGFVSLSPEIPFSVTSTYDGFDIKGAFAPRSKVTLTIKKGLKAEDGDPMESDFVKSFIFPDLPSSVSFPADGMFLTPSESPRIAIETVNTDTLSISAWKLYSNNIPIATLRANAWNNSDFTRWAKNLGTHRFAVDGMPNTTVKRALDLKALGCDVEGIYLIRADGSGTGRSRATMLVNITDTALSARTYKNGLHVWAMSIADCTPHVNATVKVYSTSNQLLCEGVTDTNGCAVFDTSLLPNDLSPALATVEHNGMFSFVKFDNNRLSGRDIDTTGAPRTDTYEGLWLMPRSLWQPGETVQASAVVRTPSLDLPGKFPLYWTLTLRGNKFADGTLELNNEGLGHISVELPLTSETGNYSLKLMIPGTETIIAERNISVADFRPPQIETAIKASDSSVPGETISFDLSARYLFGAPGSDLKWSLSYEIFPEKFFSKTFPGYVFGRTDLAEDTSTAARKSGRITSGMLNGKGFATAEWKIPAIIESSSIATASVRLDVMEASGRWTGITKDITIFPDSVQLGILVPGEPLRPGSPTEIRLAAVGTDDTPVDAGEIKVSICEVNERYVMMNENARTRMIRQRETVEIAKESVALNKEGTFIFTPPADGRYLLKFSGKDCSSSILVSAWENWSGSSDHRAAMPDRVELKSDRNSYLPGETAHISVKSPFTGRAILTLGGDSPSVIRSFNLTERETIIDVPIDDTLLPDGWLTLQVIRPERADTKPPYRALGAIPVKRDLTSRRLNVKVSAPEKTEPGNIKVAVDVTDNMGKPVNGNLCLALTDRGIMLLNGEKNPAPWSWFTRRRNPGGGLYDIYDSLLPIESRGTALLHPAGGAESYKGARMMMANGDMLSPVAAMDYKPLSLWFNDIEVINGHAEIDCKIPIFSGELNIEATVFSGALTGRGDTVSTITRPLVIDSALPRYASPGDAVQAALYITADSDGTAEISVRPGDALIFNRAGSPESIITVDLKKNQRFNAGASLPLLCVENTGRGTLTTTVRFNGRTFTRTSAMAIRPASPIVSHVTGGRADGGDTIITVPGDYFPGTGENILTLSGAPVANALSLLSTLDSWGWGICGTIGRGWIVSSLPTLADKSLTNPEETHAELSSIFATLMTYRLYDGSFGTTVSGNTDPFITAAAVHMMMAARENDPALPREAVRDGLTYLRRFMAEPLPEKHVSASLDARAYACYLLSRNGNAPLGWMHLLEEQREDLSSSARALLAAAFARSGDKQSARELLGFQSTSEASTLFFPASGFRLLALSEIAPGGEDARALAARICEILDEKHEFRNAAEAGNMLMALSTFARTVNGSAATGKLYDGDGAEIAVCDGTPVRKTLSAGKYTLHVSGEEKASDIWYSLTSSGVPVQPVPPYIRGIGITRTFTNRDGEEINPGSIPFGEEIFMNIKVSPLAEISGLRISVLLPGCFEATGTGSGAKKLRSGNVRSDLRFDRLLLLSEGTGESFEWTLPLRAVFRGGYTLPGIAADAMDNKGIGFLGKAEILQVL